MSQVLRQSTQVIVRIGPFVDATDAVTPETGVTLAAADQAEALKAAGAATVDISGNTFAAVTGAGGWYDLTLTTTDTNTIGTLTIVVQDSSVCLPVFMHFQVIEEAAYDTLYAASALPASTTNITAGTITTATNVTTVNGLAAGVITAAAVATGAIDADALAADAVAEIADGVWDEDATGHQTQGTFGQAIGDPAADTNTIYKAVVTDAAGATVGVDVVAVKADTAAILLDTGTDGVVVAAASKTGYTLSAAGLADFFDTDSGTTYASAVAGSVVKEIADNAGGTPPTAAAIADAVWDEAQADHVTAGSFGEVATETAAILVDTAEIGAAGAGLTAINLPDQTMNITGNITGNLSGSVGSVTGAVGSVTGLTASDVGAIKTQTDKMAFTVANQIDANLQSVNDVTVNGDGVGTPMGV